MRRTIQFSLLLALGLLLSGIVACRHTPAVPNVLGGSHGASLAPDLDTMYMPQAGQTKMENGMWVECPKDRKFDGSNDRLVIADLKGPGVITMIHFALPANMTLDRSTLLRIYFDNEQSPSVDSPLVDFFADPNGKLERVESMLVNKKRGWNCYFPMPFRQAARVEVVSDSKRYRANWSANPCYSYVMWRKLDSIPREAQYFHAHWRQQRLLLGRMEYRVFECDKPGHFVGWNMSIRGVSNPTAGYPVDENENFYIDGEKTPSISWLGLEDSFGFSWGFPEVANGFPYTGYQPWYNGAAAFRFCINDRINFKTVRMTVGFGPEEMTAFNDFAKPENPLELSSVAYWYQQEPHTPYEPMIARDMRFPSLIGPQTAADPARAKAHLDAGESLALDCGNPAGDIAYLKDGWDFEMKSGFSYAGFPSEIKHCWADNDAMTFDLTCPKGAKGTLKLFILDGDNFQGGRKESVTVAGRKIGDYENFQKGQWIEAPVAAADTAEGRVPVVVKNLKPGANAVVTYARFVEAK